MNDPRTRLTVNKGTPGCWRVTLDHPPINTVDDRMYDEIYDLVEAMEPDPSIKVVTFQSANPDYFLAHCGVGESSSRFGKRPTFCRFLKASRRKRVRRRS